MLTKKRESTGLKHLNDNKAFIGYSNDMDDIYENIEEYNPNMKHKVLIVFDDMIPDILSNKRLNPDIDFKDFMDLYKKCTTKPYSFLIIDDTLGLDNPLHFRKNLLERI